MVAVLTKKWQIWQCDKNGASGEKLAMVLANIQIRLLKRVLWRVSILTKMAIRARAISAIFAIFIKIAPFCVVARAYIKERSRLEG